MRYDDGALLRVMGGVADGQTRPAPLTAWERIDHADGTGYDLYQIVRLRTGEVVLQFRGVAQ